MLPHEPAQAAMLSSEHQSNRPRIVKVDPLLRSAGIKSDNPDSAPFQLLDSINQILDAHDGYVGRGAGRCFNHRSGERRGMPLGHNDSRSGAGFRSPDHSADIMRIFHTIENDNERF